MRFLPALTLIFLAMPLVASAHLFPRDYFKELSFRFITIVFPLIAVYSLYRLRRQSHLRLFLIDFIFSAIYILIYGLIFFTVFGKNEVLGEMLIFFISTFVVIIAIFSIILLGGRGVSSLSKIFIHGIITGVITIIAIQLAARIYF